MAGPRCLKNGVPRCFENWLKGGLSWFSIIGGMEEKEDADAGGGGLSDFLFGPSTAASVQASGGPEGWDGLRVYGAHSAGEALRYGDWIFLEVAPGSGGPPGFLHGEGLVLGRLALQGPPRTVHGAASRLARDAARALSSAASSRYVSRERFVPANLDECIFRVVPDDEDEGGAGPAGAARRQSAALTEGERLALAEAEERARERSEAKLAALEDANNARSLGSVEGGAVPYGAIVRLQHARSGR